MICLKWWSLLLLVCSIIFFGVTAVFALLALRGDNWSLDIFRWLNLVQIECAQKSPAAAQKTAVSQANEIETLQAALAEAEKLVEDMHNLQKATLAEAEKLGDDVHNAPDTPVDCSKCSTEQGLLERQECPAQHEPMRCDGLRIFFTDREQLKGFCNELNLLLTDLRQIFCVIMHSLDTPNSVSEKILNMLGLPYEAFKSDHDWTQEQKGWTNTHLAFINAIIKAPFQVCDMIKRVMEQQSRGAEQGQYEELESKTEPHWVNMEESFLSIQPIGFPCNPEVSMRNMRARLTPLWFPFRKSLLSIRPLDTLTVHT